MSLKVTRVALSPFDTRFELSSAHRQSCEELGLTLIETHPWMERLLGEKPCAYRVDDERILLLSQQGFGLNMRRVSFELESLADHKSLAAALIERARHHRSLRVGAHEDLLVLDSLKKLVFTKAHRNEQRLVRPDLWLAPPYTLSFFYIPQSAEHMLRSDNDLRGLSALLEPSQILLSELSDQSNQAADCARLIGELNISDQRERWCDTDIKAGCDAFCSWAGMVVFDSHRTDLAYFESLEIRLQLAWLKAAFVRRWAELLLTQRSLEAEKLTSVASEVTPLLRQTRRLIDATASSRDQQLFDRLVETSELAREITGAEDALEDVLAQIELARAARRRAYDLTVESLLLVLALLQAVPLFFDVPFTELSPWALAPAGVLFVVFAILRGMRM